jgi:hypothetical protein
MLRITISTVGPRTRIALEGRLVGPSVEPLRACWSREAERRDPADIEIALADVVFIDARGSELLRSIHAQGAELLAEDPLVRAILDDLCGKPERRR